jgi:hypothetical protein
MGKLEKGRKNIQTGLTDKYKIEDKNQKIDFYLLFSLSFVNPVYPV